MGGPCTVDGQVRHELDNFHQCQIRMDGAIWPTAEHYYQASKFPSSSQHREAIRSAASGWDCYKLGQCHDEDLRPDWEEVKVEMISCQLRQILTECTSPE